MLRNSYRSHSSNTTLEQSARPTFGMPDESVLEGTRMEDTASKPSQDVPTALGSALELSREFIQSMFLEQYLLTLLPA